ncbi:MAG: hypothetical protein RL042_1012 [Nitrospirota bacterium]|jgi:hypothetical protein
MSMIAGSKIESLLIEMESDWMPPAFSMSRLPGSLWGENHSADHGVELEF